MAIFLNNKVGFKVATVDLSDHVTAFSLNRQADQLEVTAMGDTSHKFVTGLSADTITVTFLNDTAAGSVLATLQAISPLFAIRSLLNILFENVFLVDSHVNLI